MTILRRVLLVIVEAFLIWGIVSYHISDYYLGQAQEGDALGLERALVWNPRQPDALFRKAEAVFEKDPAAALTLLRRSFSENPASSFPLLALARDAQSADEQDRASALIEMAVKITPTSPRIQIAAGYYWADMGDIETGMKYWSRALETTPDVFQELFPILLSLVEEPRAIGLFRPFAESPPSWWKRFFQEVSGRARNLEAVRVLFAYRRAAEDAPLTPAERNYYVERLQREGRITEAYLVWKDGLDKDERAHLGILYNGNFEIEPTNTGFDWHIRNTDHVVVRTEATAGVDGKEALHLIFKDKERRYQHIYQPLSLQSGAYRVSGAVRTDSLNSKAGLNKGGLKWVVYCLFPETANLGESEHFVGTSEWREFSFVVRVPSECTAQEIRLVSAGARQFEYEMTGGIWFDDISMSKVRTRSTDVASSSGAESLEGLAAGLTKASQSPAPENDQEPVFSFGPTLIESLRGGED